MTTKPTLRQKIGILLSVAALALLGLWLAAPYLLGASAAGGRRALTLAEADQIMREDGSLYKYILSRKKDGAISTTPKYPGKAWDWFCQARVEPGETKLPDFYRQEAYQETLRRNMDKSKLRGQRAAAWRHIRPVGSSAQPHASSTQPAGRIAELAVHPTNAQTIYAASAGGGVWRTTNRGGSWTNLTDGNLNDQDTTGELPSIGMGSVAIDPFNTTTIYCGLGEGATGGNYEPYGAGVYKSTDNGSTWNLVNNTAQMRFVTDIAVGATTQTLLIAAKGDRDGSTGAGLWRTTDGGANWVRELTFSSYSISVDPANRNNVVMSGASSIQRSTNGGDTWTQAWSNGSAGRIELTRNGNTLYAVAGSWGGTLQALLKSTNGGQTWTTQPTTGITFNHTYYGSSQTFSPAQMTYNCSIQVSPYDANTVYLGSNLVFYKSANGGTSWTRAAWWQSNNPSAPPYMHADHHTIRFGENNNTVYVGCDGGFFYTTNGGTSWVEANNDYDSLQLYRFDINRTNASALIMGCQDNDKYVRRPGGVWQHNPNTFGDCMHVVAYDGAGSIFMGANYYAGAMAITEDGGANWSYSLRGYNGANNGIPNGEQGAWVAPFFTDPLSTNTLYLCAKNVYRAQYTQGMQPTWTQILALPGQPFFMDQMEVTLGATDRKLVGVLDTQRVGGTQRFFRANIDGSGYATKNLPQAGYINVVAPDPTDNNVVWIGYSNIGEASASTSKARLYRSDNLGDSWTNMTNNFPQNLPVSAIFIDPDNAQTIIVGSDIGAYRSDDGGANWVFWNEGLPRVVITDFDFYPATRTLKAGTYGRGVWETEIGGIPDIAVDPMTLTVPEP
jgi:photosystem II stability/assembly factor-like uncharacterized protein